MAGETVTYSDFRRKVMRRTRLNEQSTLAFIAFMLAIAAVFITLHWVRRYGRRPQDVQGEAGKPSALASFSRRIRSVSLRRAPGLPSVGHAGLVGLYVAINITIALTNLDNDNMSMILNVASRTGWLAMANMVVVIILALKNTPLSFLIAWSHERLNIFHQVAGYATVVHVIVHASCYFAYLILQSGHPDTLQRKGTISGMVAWLSFVLLGFGGAVIRRRWYELFYYMHISLWIIAIVTVGFHQPNLKSKFIVATFLAGGIWVLDRLIRLARLVLYSTNNSVQLTPLPNGGTRVTLTKPPVGAASGTHCFLWIPKIRSCETHPFTIAAVDPLEFIVASYDGFTSDLRRYAVSHPGAFLRASVEGPYGAIPDPAEYYTVVMVAGGSGASFTFGVALDMLRRLPSDASKQIVFIWAVKHSASLDWFSSHLITLRNDGRVSSKLFVTRQPQPEMASPMSGSNPKQCVVVTESEMGPEKAVASPSASQSSSISIDSEKSPSPSEMEASTGPTEADWPNSIHGIPITYERPDVTALIRSAVDETPASRRVLVLSCGPDELTTQSGLWSSVGYSPGAYLLSSPIRTPNDNLTTKLPLPPFAAPHSAVDHPATDTQSTGGDLRSETMSPPRLAFHPPLLNSACPWATTQHDIRALLCCPSTGAVTTRTSLLDGFAHDDAVHRYAFIDPARGTPLGAEADARGPVGSVNSLGYSPIPLDGYISIVRRLAASLPAAMTRKAIIMSVTGDPVAVAGCYAQISLAAPSVPFPLAMELNLSCPNIPGSPPPAYTPSALTAYLAALPSTPALPVGVKLPPFTYASQFTALVQTLRPYASRLSFITAVNTLGSCLVFEGGVGDGTARGMLQGGMAGAPLHSLALGNVATLRRLLDDVEELRHVVIIGVGGVSDGDGYRRMRRVGATAVGVATGLGSKGNRVFEEIERHVGSSW
ncbi:ferric reductase transmembrane component [Tolypocladium capitatum]|uniref:Dihydroorotate dehydrogenase (fumarate) n=1 Tax=Tolypocladium capitatum TaxID=45235 RepID=A0A2K3QFQ7_9HYPO|nr:ferric reductase transmembrane component [Tolypocladium capitatum]